MIMPKMWTFVVKGGEGFQLKIPVHPILDHDGTNTIWKASLEAMEAVEIKKAIESNGASVDIFHEEESPEQLEERSRRLGHSVVEMPTAICPTCFFFDVAIEIQCQNDGWPNNGEKEQAGDCPHCGAPCLTYP